MANTDLTAQQAREIFDYNPETGVFTRKANTRGKYNSGRTAGIEHNEGYFSLCANGKKYLAHRVAWLHVTGEWPKADIDHINGNRADNRFENLRDVSRSVNLQNRRSPKKTSSSRFLGVSFSKHKKDNPWVAQIKTGGKIHNLGYFSTEEAAHEAYLRKKREVHEGCTI